MHACILLFGHNQNLLRTRLLMLTQAGYCVYGTSDVREVDHLAVTAEEPITMVLLCQSVAMDVQEKVITVLRGRFPDVLSVSLLPYAHQQNVRSCADAVLIAEGPEHFLNTIHTLFGLPAKGKEAKVFIPHGSPSERPTQARISW